MVVPWTSASLDRGPRRPVRHPGNGRVQRQSSGPGCGVDRIAEGGGRLSRESLPKSEAAVPIGLTTARRRSKQARPRLERLHFWQAAGASAQDPGIRNQPLIAHGNARPHHRWWPAAE